MRALARRLSCTVTDVTIGSGSIPPGEKLSELLGRLEGKPLTGRRFVDILLDVMTRSPRGASGVLLHAEREGIGRGVAFRVTLLGRDPKGDPPGARTGWQHRSWIRFSDKEIASRGGWLAREYGTLLSAHAGLIGDIDKVLFSPSDFPFVIRSRIRLK